MIVENLKRSTPKIIAECKEKGKEPRNERCSACSEVVSTHASSPEN